jgi:signal transduction histidine kinase
VARTVAHELNNTLSPVVGYADLLALHPAVRDDPVALGYAHHIAEAAQQAAETIARLQRIVRLEYAPTGDGSLPITLDIERSIRPTRRRAARA